MTVVIRPLPTRIDDVDLRPIDPPLTTAAWYGDLALPLTFPVGWEVVVHEPTLPPALDIDALRAAIRTPLGTPPLATLAAGARRVVIIVDDLTRPTPVERILPLILDELAAAGVRPDQAAIVVASGTHGRPSEEAVARKLGDSGAGIQAVAHDDLADCLKVGVTSFGTPVLVNRVVAAADLVLGVGGVYPQHSTGFGGGSKLALGVLGRASIARLHFSHPSMAGSYDVDNDFRSDLNEVATMIGLRWMAMAHVDAHRQNVRLVSGDPISAYPSAAAFSRERFAAPPPGDADVVIANAYPMDISATFMRSKGIIPLLHTRPEASRILLAACPGGIGHHGLFPLDPPVGLARVQRRFAVARARGWTAVGRLGVAVASRPFRRTSATPAGPQRPRILMYQTIEGEAPVEDRLPGMQVVPDWSKVIETVTARQADKAHLRVAIYPCAPLQVFEPDGS